VSDTNQEVEEEIEFSLFQDEIRIGFGDNPFKAGDGSGEKNSGQPGIQVKVTAEKNRITGKREKKKTGKQGKGGQDQEENRIGAFFLV
jgi:hypothetical protein